MEAFINRRLQDLQEKLGVDFKNQLLLLQAITHKSYLNECVSHPTAHYERLEFLGDAVLEIVVTEKLFHSFQEASECHLTNHRMALVSTAALGPLGEKLELHKFVFMSRGEQRDVENNQKQRRYLCTCVLEAILGALYLDQGIGSCRILVDHFIHSQMTKLISVWKDDLSWLQEEVQGRFALTPTYEVLESWGADHAKRFTVGCFLDGAKIAQGDGRSKKEAKAAAATSARKTITQWERLMVEVPRGDSTMRRSGKGK